MCFTVSLLFVTENSQQRDRDAELLRAWTSVFVAILPRLSGLRSFTWSHPKNMPLQVLKAIMVHDKIKLISLNLREDGVHKLLPTLNILADNEGRTRQIYNLSVITGTPEGRSADDPKNEPPLSEGSERPPPLHRILRKLISSSLALETLVFTSEHNPDDEEDRPFRESPIMMRTATSHPLRNLRVQGECAMASYTLLGLHLSKLACLELLNVHDCSRLIQAITCGITEANLRILRVAGLQGSPDQKRSTRVALRNLLNAFEGLEEIVLDGVDTDNFVDSVIHHAATLHTLSLMDDNAENRRAGNLEIRARSYLELAKRCPHLRQLRVNEVPNVVGIADAFVGNALQRLTQLENLILMSSPSSLQSKLHPLTDTQIYSAARDVTPPKLKTLEVVGAYVPTQCPRFDVFGHGSHPDVVYPERMYHWKIDCRKRILSPINLMPQIETERSLSAQQQNENLAMNLGKPKQDALLTDALHIDAVNCHNQAIRRLRQASSSSKMSSEDQTSEQSMDDLMPSTISLGYECEQAWNYRDREG